MTEAEDLTGRHALVTGGYKGIGAAISRRLAARGAKVTILARDGAAAATFAEGLPHARAAACDITDAARVAEAFADAAAAFGPVDILVANAGGTTARPLAEESVEGFREGLEVNLVGVFTCMKAALPAMTDAGWGRIVVVASTAGLKAYPGVAAYVAAKHGAVGLVRAAALETARRGVTVNAVCPGYTETDLAAQAVAAIAARGNRTEAEARAVLARTNPMGRLIDPAEVANTVEWLVMPGSESITGQAIAVAGGEVMG
ncbi:SDR family oxidoreductase [Marivibrio halodurans]|uniref:SDR family oxidoreductase n=1 Tax=Marivibrio halodurans TaxID=2039722 RepID=A0A8J7SM79_9PROT|nr:SDR family NAD(P)-dependent oxidoreductase [Marivibrio halodurans]MBP5857238.1 SDR family oxidoreductase [Marivibrio halodurans]